MDLHVDVGGGLVNGDRTTLAIDVDARAMALVSTQASTKVYRSPAGCQAELDAHVGVGAVLVHLPDPVVCFEASRYAQVQRFDLAPGASLACLDWLSCGRQARGERWAFDRYDSRLRVRASDRLLLADATVLDAADGDLAARFGPVNVLATILLAGPRFEADARRLVERASAEPPPRSGQMRWSAAPLPGSGGCLVRMAGTSVEEVGRLVREYLRTVPAVLGDDPWARKW